MHRFEYRIQHLKRKKNISHFEVKEVHTNRCIFFMAQTSNISNVSAIFFGKKDLAEVNISNYSFHVFLQLHPFFFVTFRQKPR